MKRFALSNDLYVIAGLTGPGGVSTMPGVGDERDKANILRIGLTQVKLSDYVEADDLLRSSPLFRAISSREKQLLLQRARVRLVRSGEVVIEEGAASESLYFLLDGLVRLSMQGGMADLGTLSKGYLFGLSSVVPDAIRPQVVAEGDVRLALFPADHVRVLMQTAPPLEKLLLSVAAERKRLAEDGSTFFDRW